VLLVLLLLVQVQVQVQVQMQQLACTLLHTRAPADLFLRVAL
jgi:hypothetical protein